MANQLEFLVDGCASFGLKIEVGYIVELPSGVLLTSVARIPDIGAANGMLIFNKSSVYWPHHKELTEAGYGYSSWLDEENHRESGDFYEMICDSGWKT